MVKIGVPSSVPGSGRQSSIVSGLKLGSSPLASWRMQIASCAMQPPAGMLLMEVAMRNRPLCLAGLCPTAFRAALSYGRI